MPQPAHWCSSAWVQASGYSGHALCKLACCRKDAGVSLLPRLASWPLTACHMDGCVSSRTMSALPSGPETIALHSGANLSNDSWHLWSAWTHPT